MRESKITCRVNDQWDGIFQLVEHELHGGERFGPFSIEPVRLWGGTIDLACSYDECLALWGEDLHLALADGRLGKVRCLSVKAEESYFGEQPGRMSLLYAVGLTLLAVPGRP